MNRIVAILSVMDITNRARRAAGVALAMTTMPRQMRHLPRLLRTAGRHPLQTRAPWLAFDLVDWLDGTLRGDSVVFEYGGGGSTAWFSDRVKFVVSAEHNPEWATSLRETFGETSNVELLQSHTAEDWDEYIGLIDRYPDEFFDLVLIDGRERLRCLDRSIPKVRPGGYLILDDFWRPRYAPAAEKLATWERRDFRGIAPGKTAAGHSVVWTKPG
jgi:hypothetical protein